MNIGDKVRMIHSNEEGIISKVVNHSIIEVEIEEGFHIPVKKTEVVLIDQQESVQFGNDSIIKSAEEPTQAVKPKVFSHHGIYVAFRGINDRRYGMYLINNTDYDLPFVLGQEQNQRYQGIYAATLKSRDSIKVYEVDLQDFENWGIFIFQFLYFTFNAQPLKEPLVKRVRFRADSFFKSKQEAPLLKKEAYVLQIDQDQKIESIPLKEEKATSLDPQKIKEKMFENTDKASESKPYVVKPPKIEVDLHIEEITPDFAKLNSGEILEQQLQVFETNLESAIACGMYEITFIHGVGNGKLRQEIHRRLAGNADIKYFQDAQREKFGYGATLVRFK